MSKSAPARVDVSGMGEAIAVEGPAVCVGAEERRWAMASRPSAGGGDGDDEGPASCDDERADCGKRREVAFPC